MEQTRERFYARRRAHYRKNLQNAREGKLNCIPSPFVRFRREFPGIEQGTYYLVTGNEKSGKCFGKGTKVRKYDGSLINVEDVKVGETLMGNDSTLRTVLEVHSGIDDMYKITQNNGGVSFTVNSKHILYLYHHKKYFTMSVEDYLKKDITFKSECMQVQSEAIEYEREELPIDPYFYGLWLGDGDTKEISIANNDEKVQEFLYEYANKIGCSIKLVGNPLPSSGLQIRHLFSSKSILQSKDSETGEVEQFSSAKEAANNNDNHHCYITRATSSGKKHGNKYWKWKRRKGHFRSIFKEVTGFQKNFINPKYLKGSSENRFKLLAGIIDSDGNYSTHSTKNNYTVVTKLYSLAKNIQELAWSLGLRANISNKYIKKYDTTYYNVTISGKNCVFIPIKIERKKYVPKTRNRPINRAFNIEHIGKAKYYGFETDGNHLFLLEDYTIVHNSQISDYLFLLHPMLYAYLNPDKLKLKILYFSLEMSRAQKQDKLTCFWLYYKSGGRIRISTKELNSLHEGNPVDEETLDLLDTTEYEDFFNFMEDNLIFEEEISNPTGINIAVEKFAKSRGTFTYKDIQWKDVITGEISTRKVIDEYIPNDPDEYCIIITDHLTLLSTEKGMDLRGTIGKFSSDFCVKLRNRYNYTIVNIQQQSATSQDNESFKLNRLAPHPGNLAENKSTKNDLNSMFGIFSPASFNKKEWEGYNIEVFQDNIRFLENVLNRDGSPGTVCPLYFDGAVNWFQELPLPNDTEALRAFEIRAKKAQGLIS